MKVLARWAVAVGLLVFIATPVLALTVHRSGTVFHVAACDEHVGYAMARCHAQVVSDGAGNLVVRNIPPRGHPFGYGPIDLRSAYGIVVNGQQSTTIAIVDAYGYTNAERDLGIYRATFGLPVCSSANGCFRKFNQNGTTGAYPKDSVGWSEETALDLEMASAMCPNCRIILVEANTASFADLAAAENEAAALGAHVISNSYGGYEAGSKPFAPAYDHPGVAITVSSGDGGYGVSFPASAPTVTAVGGTSLVASTDGRGWTETAWAYAGSGCSKFYKKPVWQTDPLCPKRMVADVSAVADPYTGVAVYAPLNANRSAWLVFGGTSVGAPLIAGVYGVNGGVVTPGSPYLRQHLLSLHDVHFGENGSCGSTYFCTASVGYDGPTGLGTPNGSQAF